MFGYSPEKVCALQAVVGIRSQSVAKYQLETWPLSLAVVSLYVRASEPSSEQTLKVWVVHC